MQSKQTRTAARGRAAGPALSLALAALGSIGMLTGCGGDEGDEPVVPVDVDEDFGDDEPVVIPGGPTIKPPPAPPPPPPEIVLRTPAPEATPDPSLVDAARAAKLLARLDDLGEGALRQPPTEAPPEGLDEKQLLARRQKRVNLLRAWEGALGGIISKATEYIAAAGHGAAVPRAFYKRGTARVLLADRKTSVEAWELRHYGAADLRRFLDGAEPDDERRAGASAHLGRSLLLTSQDDPERRLQAVPYLSTAVERLLREGRAEQAGDPAYLLFSTLIGLERDADVEDLAERFAVARTDLGRNTKVIRRLALRGRIRPDAPMPTLPVVDAVDGSPLFVPGELDGKPYVLHFFKTDVSTRTKEIEEVLVPLWRERRDDGLGLVGVSVDWEMPPAYLERQQALAEEVGSDWVVYDGQRASVRKWAEERGLAWRWYWDGKWGENAVAAALGVPTNEPFAILVDQAGTIRWRGHPAQGLTEAVTKLLDE